MNFRIPTVNSLLYKLDKWRTADLKEFGYLRYFEHSQYFSEKKLAALQLQQLKNLVSYALDHCVFYREQLDNSGISVNQIASLADLTLFPILTKQQIQDQYARMISNAFLTEALIQNRTGGSTGTPITFYLDHDRRRSRAAATWRHNHWAGYYAGDKLAVLWGAARDLKPKTTLARWKDHLLAPTIALNTAQITARNLKDFINAWNWFRPKHLLAYAKSAAMFARFVHENRVAIRPIKSVITSAEVLEDSERRLIENVFQCKVFNRYGSREVSVIASECEYHDGLHIMAEGLLVEIVKDGRPAQPGELGGIIVTDLLNRGMPLIRYRIGDAGTWLTGPCKCGRSLPRLANVQGRVTDFLVGCQGQLVSGAALTVTVIAQRPSLGQVQLIQERKNHVLFRIAPPGNGTIGHSDQQFLIEQFKAYLGDEMQFDFEFVKELVAEPSGKFIFCKSHLQPFT
jgi:phenylacetate-CoA ligase